MATTISTGSAFASRSSTSARSGVRDVARFAQRVIDAGKAKFVGGSVMKNRPPVGNAESFPSFPMKNGRAYVIKGHVYAKVASQTLNGPIWLDVGRAPRG